MTGSDHLDAAWRYLEANAPLLFLQLDAKGRVSGANRFARERIGADWLGKNIKELFLFTEKNPGPMVLRKQPGRIHLMHLPTASGLPETFRVQFYPAGEETMVFGSLDADETMRLRKELIALNNRLNVLTRELQQKNRELEELNRLKNQFLGMAAHDLRKPVGAILNYTEFLMEEAEAALETEHFSFLRTIHGSTDLMRRVIDDFLDISMIESGRFAIDLAPANMCAVVEKSVSLNRLPAKKKGVTLSVECKKSPPPVALDGVKIEQVLNNLIANAVEHSPPDSKVEVRVSADETGVVVSVADSGPGVTDEERKSLFTPFTKGKAVKSPGSKSTGLGLAISKKIVEAHRGRIWIEKDRGHGGVFSFRIPYAEQASG